MRKSFKKLWLPGILTIMIMALAGWQCSRSPGDLMPAQLGQLSLTERYQGAEADKMIEELHGKSVGGRQNYIGEYRSGDGAATLYISIYPQADSARKDLLQMMHGIVRGGTPFQHFVNFKQKDQEVFMVLGMGQVHYFFQHDRQVIWLAVDSPYAQKSLNDLLDFILKKS